MKNIFASTITLNDVYKNQSDLLYEAGKIFWKIRKPKHVERKKQKKKDTLQSICALYEEHHNS